MFTDAQRDAFDTEFEAVLDSLPDEVHNLLDEVPLILEDYPSPQVLRDFQLSDPGQLCGLYTGVPLTHRSVDSPRISDQIYIYRLGITQLSSDRRGVIDPARLREQIRITVLHEVGHHFGLSEADLAELGYD